MKKKYHKKTAIILFFIISCNINVDKNLSDCLNTFSNLGSDQLENESNVNHVFVIGHAYGSHAGDNLGLSKNVLSFVKQQKLDNQILILTGDIVRENTIKNLQLVKNQIETNFSEYYVAVGYHDVGIEGLDNFYSVFNNDLNFIRLSSIDLIVANFTTSNWKPTLEDQESINNFIRKSSKDTIIIFSHQVFWYNLTEKKPKLNETGREVSKDIHEWIQNENKNLIIISGDYGKDDPETFCEYDTSENVLYIASGVYENIEDRALVINDAIKGFSISELKLSDYSG